LKLSDSLKTSNIKMKKFLLLFLSIGIMAACSSDDDSSGSNDNVTSAEITLLDANSDLVSGMTVYAYSESTWEVIGNDTFFADFQAASNSEGIATFSDLTTDTEFNELTNYTHTYRFVVNYSIDGTDTSKVLPITFELGDDISETITLD